MDVSDLVNLIVKKLGGNRVEFLRISCADDASEIDFCHADNCYNIIHDEDDSKITVRQFFKNLGPLEQNNYTAWMEGVLNGKVRNEAGEMVDSI